MTKVNSSCFNGGALPRSTDAAAGFPGPGKELLLPSVGAAARGARAGVVPGARCLSGPARPPRGGTRAPCQHSARKSLRGLRGLLCPGSAR